MVGGTLAPVVPWHAMVFLSNDFLGGGYGGGALISDRWVLTSGRTLFVRKGQNNSRDDSPLIPKVYLGISGLAQANKSTEHPVEKVSSFYYSSSSSRGLCSSVIKSNLPNKDNLILNEAM